MLIIGDSLSAAYGMQSNQGWVALLQKALQKEPITVVNASISGDTSENAKRRLNKILSKQYFDYIIIEIGGNDGLRGLPLTALQQNLQQMIQLAKAQKSKVLLLGIKIPPNYGPIYQQGFDAVYTFLSKQEKIPLVPFILQGIAEDLNNMQPDGIHPKANQQVKILANVLPAIRKLIQ